VPRRLPLALLAACLLGPAAEAQARQVPFGLNDATSPQRLERSRALGSTVGRLFICWCDLEPAPGRYDLHRLDRIYADFVAHRIRPVLNVVGTPSWAEKGCARVPRPCLRPPDERHLRRWRGLFRLLAARYPRLFGVEVWNEANLAHFWKPRADVPRYVRLLKAAYRGAKSADPDLPVVAGALCLCGGGRGGVHDFAFLDGMYRAGARGHFDAIGVHPYPTDYPVIANARDKMAQMRRVRDRWRDRTPFWVTEAGLSTAVGGTGGHPRLTEPLQGRALAALYKTLRQMADVDVVILFRYGDITGGFTTWEDGLGIVERADGSLKPAAVALAAAVGGRRPYRRPPPVGLRASARRVPVGQRVVIQVVGWRHRPVNGARWVLWDVGGGGFYKSTAGRPWLERRWARPGLRRVGVRAGDELDAGEAFITIRVMPRRRQAPR
jgi:polysaccharide biosynthesis protein PslG